MPISNQSDQPIFPPPWWDIEMRERIARMEGEARSLRRIQDLTLAAVLGVGAILAAFIIGFGFYTFQKVDLISDRVNDLPNKISSELRDITRTLAASITAAKQQPPQVILMPPTTTGGTQPSPEQPKPTGPQ
jgi:hypothetical protein